MLKRQDITFGTDPELFLSRNGRVLASEKVIPEEGLSIRTGAKPIVVRDGVQVELNPESSSSIPGVLSNICTSMRNLRAILAKEDNVTVDWSGTVDVDMDELNTLSPATRLLGCNPSDNYYGAKPINVDPFTFRQRSAGGHIHLGLNPSSHYSNNMHSAARELIPVADILVGNTLVMLDRDPRAAERRLNYGRAGEFRRPKYGVEYRTLSNFWLRSPILADLAFGLSNFAVCTFACRFAYNSPDHELQLAELVGKKIGDFRKAIDTNDYGLARANFEKIRPYFVGEHVPTSMFPLNQTNIDRFLLLTEQVRDLGLTSVFPVDPFEAWCDKPHVDFQTFLKEY
jgi:hypothetical protein